MESRAYLGGRTCEYNRYSNGCNAGWRSSALLTPLLDRVHASELTAISKQPEALALVLPAIMAILSESATGAAIDSNTAATVLEVRHLGFCPFAPRATDRVHAFAIKALCEVLCTIGLQVLQALANTLPRCLLETTLLPLVASGLEHGSVPMQLACLEPALLNKLQAVACLAAFQRTVLPAVMSMVVDNDKMAHTQGTTPSAAPQVTHKA